MDSGGIQKVCGAIYAFIPVFIIKNHFGMSCIIKGRGLLAHRHMRCWPSFLMRLPHHPVPVLWVRQVMSGHRISCNLPNRGPTARYNGGVNRIVKGIRLEPECKSIQIKRKLTFIGGDR